MKPIHATSLCILFVLLFASYATAADRGLAVSGPAPGSATALGTYHAPDRGDQRLRRVEPPSDRSKGCHRNPRRPGGPIRVRREERHPQDKRRGHPRPNRPGPSGPGLRPHGAGQPAHLLCRPRPARRPHRRRLLDPRGGPPQGTHLLDQPLRAQGGPRVGKGPAQERGGHRGLLLQRDPAPGRAFAPEHVGPGPTRPSWPRRPPGVHARSSHPVAWSPWPTAAGTGTASLPTT